MTDNPAAIFWAVLIFASIFWYAFLLFYVGLKAGHDIKNMTDELSKRPREE